MAAVCAVLCLLLPACLYGRENWIEKGLELSAAGRYDQAIEAFSKAAEITPQNVDAYNNRGAVWFYKGDLDRAAADFTLALKIDPHHGEACNNRGMVWFRLQDFNRAIADFTRALEFNPAYEDAYINRGIVWYRKKDYDAAIDDYTRAIEINPRAAVTYNNRGAAWYRKGTYHQAVIDYSQALELDGHLFDAFRNRAIAWYQIGAYERAVADFSAALILRPEAAVVYNDRGRVFFKQGRYEQALSDVNRSLELDGQLVDARRHLAWMLAVCPDPHYRNGKQAVLLARALLTDPLDFPVAEILAAAYAEAGRYREALATQQKVVAGTDRYRNPAGWEVASARLEAYRNKRSWREPAHDIAAGAGAFPCPAILVDPTAELRGRPDKEAPAIAAISRATPLWIIDQIDQWMFVEFAGNRFGWGHASLFSRKGAGFQKADAKAPPDAAADRGAPKAPAVDTAVMKTLRVRVPLARFRRSADADAAVVFRLIGGASPELLEKQGDWYRVKLQDGRTGWGHASLFAENGESESGFR